MMLTLFNGLGEDNCKTRRETLKCWELVRLVSGFDGNVYNSHASANWTTRIHLDIATTTAAQQKYAHTFEMYYIHTPGSPRYVIHGTIAIYHFPPQLISDCNLAKNSSAHNSFLSHPVEFDFCREHGSAKFQNDLTNEMNVMDERDIALFQLKMSFGEGEGHLPLQQPLVSSSVDPVKMSQHHTNC